jgi:hypothetical protein
MKRPADLASCASAAGIYLDAATISCSCNLLAAAAVAQKIVPAAPVACQAVREAYAAASTRVQDAIDSSPFSSMLSSTDSSSTEESSLSTMNMATAAQHALLTALSTHQQHSTPPPQQLGASTVAGPCTSGMKQLLLAGRPPFALFAQQPSQEGWLKLLHALQNHMEEETAAAAAARSALLLRGRGSACSIARQHAVGRRATLQ